jgi:hypothetical protein
MDNNNYQEKRRAEGYDLLEYKRNYLRTINSKDNRIYKRIQKRLERTCWHNDLSQFQKFS